MELHSFYTVASHSCHCALRWQGTPFTFTVHYVKIFIPYTVHYDDKALLWLYKVTRNYFHFTIWWQWHSFHCTKWEETAFILQYDDNGTPSTIHHYDKALFSLYSIMTMALLSLQHTSWWQGTPFTLQYDENGTPFTKHRDKALLSL